MRAVDCTCMAEQVQSNTNQGQVEGIHMVNQLGPGVKIASLPELGPGKDQLCQPVRTTAFRPTALAQSAFLTPYAYGARISQCAYGARSECPLIKTVPLSSFSVCLCRRILVNVPDGMQPGPSSGRRARAVPVRHRLQAGLEPGD